MTPGPLYFHNLQAEDVLAAAARSPAAASAGGSPSRLMRATAASAPSKITFSVSWTLRLPRAQVVEHVREHTRPVAVPHDQPVRGRRARRQVDDVRDLAGLRVDADDAHRLGGDRLLRLIGRRADVMRAVDVRQRRRSAARTTPAPPAGSSGKTSSADAEAARLHGVGQRRVVDELRPRGVDEERARPAGGSRIAAPTKFRVSGVSARCRLSTSLCAGHLLRRRQHRRRRDRAATPPAPPRRRARSAGSRRPPCMPNAVGAARHLLADAAEAEQAERAAVQPARLRVLLLVPAPGAQVGDVVGNAAVEREDQAERELRDGDRVPARAVRDVDAAPRGRGARRSC